MIFLDGWTHDWSINVLYCTNFAAHACKDTKGFIYLKPHSSLDDLCMNSEVIFPPGPSLYILAVYVLYIKSRGSPVILLSVFDKGGLSGLFVSPWSQWGGGAVGWWVRRDYSLIRLFCTVCI